MVSSAAVTAADTIYHVDRLSEDGVLAWFGRHWPRAEPVEIVMEGLEGGAVTFPRGVPVARTAWKCILDPIDGTRAFITGRHEWGSLIALEKDEVPVLGMIDQPVLGERFLGVHGRTVLIEGEKRTPLRVRECADLKDSTLCATDPSQYFSPEQQAGFARVKTAARLTRYCGDCYLFAVLAMGFVDVVIEANFSRWDIAALIPIVEGAGGIITAWDGGDCRDGKTILACGDRRAHEQAMALLAPR